MHFVPNLRVDLVPLPDLGGVPFDELLKGMLGVGFEPRATRALLEEANARLAVPALRPQGVEDGGYLVTEQVLFPQESTWWMVLQEGEARWSTPLPEDAILPVADFLRQATRNVSLEALRAAWPFDDESWQERLFTAAPPGPRWPETSAPGLYRREHASLFIRSRTTGILVDPIGLQRRLPHMELAPLFPAPLPVDAVAITHSHVDHWHVPSLLAHLPGHGTPVLVPRVPRPSLLTFQDFAQVLRACGQQVLAPAWGETVRVGDIEVDILPFYGEQPVGEGPPVREGLRNWGNCYRFTTEDFSCLLLVDSGSDPEGHMAQVVADSCRRRGPVDVVLACQREFLSPFFGGLSHYWAALPWARLQQLYRDYQEGRLRSGTAGPAGAAALCAAAQARYFLAYANGFEGVGNPITDVGWGEGEPSEAHCNALMREELARLGASTQVLEGRPGEVLRFERGQRVLEEEAGS